MAVHPFETLSSVELIDYALAQGENSEALA